MMDKKEKWQGPDRRKNKDIWVVIFQRLSLIGWSMFTVALVVSFYAAPEKEYGITRYFGIEVRDYWESPLTDYLYGLLWVTALFSLAALIISHFRTRRATDNKYYNLTLLFIVCLAWVIYIARHAYW
ncbi:hypothetical protein ACFSJY_10905 [Thalassotalea euphylliae]|uniref:hypothetical protein n=1 Tax=Thalassotalea euphylliae TaxID=1655234 RepID=UPI0036339331